MTNRGDLAIAYAIREWPPFPLQVNGKRPATRSGFNAATLDLVTLRRWWSKTDWNVGIACGAARLFIVDLDVNPEKGPPGIAWWEIVCKQYGFKTYETYFVLTPSGGLHIYFTVPEGITTYDGVRSAGNGALSHLKIPNVDIRANGGYVAAVGSVIDGIEYEHHGADQPLPMPQFLIDLVQSKTSNGKSIMARAAQAKNDMIAGPAAIEKAIQGMVNYVMSATVGERNKVLNDTYWWVQRNHPGWTEDTKLHAIWRLQAAGREIGLTEREVADTLRTRGQ